MHKVIVNGSNDSQFVSLLGSPGSPQKMPQKIPPKMMPTMASVSPGSSLIKPNIIAKRPPVAQPPMGPPDNGLITVYRCAECQFFGMEVTDLVNHYTQTHE